MNGSGLTSGREIVVHVVVSLLPRHLPADLRADGRKVGGDVRGIRVVRARGNVVHLFENLFSQR